MRKFCPSIGLLLCLILPFEALSIPEGPPGATTGDIASTLKGLVLGVNTNENSGTATFSFSFAVPPGRNGLQPQLALSYAHTAGAGAFGKGWDLNLPRIERIQRLGVPDYSQTDLAAHLPSGVAELVPISFVSFAPRIDEQHFQVWNHADGYRLRDKSGMLYEFGTNPSARIGPNTNRRDGTFAWYVTRITDTNGNTIDFNYQKSGGYTYVMDVRYGGHSSGSMNHVYVMQFGYLDRRYDQRRLSYAAGFRQEAERTLNTVAIRNVAKNRFVRRYELTWVDSSTNRGPILKTITPFGSDNSTSLPPTTFDYYPDYQWPGVEDTEVELFSTHVGAGIEEDQFSPGEGQYGDVRGSSCITAAMADLNGDGLPDLVKTTGPDRDGDRLTDLNIVNGKSIWRVRFNRGRNAQPMFTDPIDWSAPDSCTNLEYRDTPNNYRINAALVDLNGDGTVELVDTRDDNSNERWLVYFAEDEGFEAEPIYWPTPAQNENRARPISHGIRNFVLGGDDHPVLDNVQILSDLVDLNGDGRSELISLPVNSSELEVYWNTGNGFDLNPDFIAFPGRTGSIRGGAGGAFERQSNIDFDLFDLNGDGLPDRIEAMGTKDPDNICDDGYHWYVWFGTGRGFKSSAECWDSPDQLRIREWDRGFALYDVVDMNADRLPDFVDATNFRSDGQWHIYRNTGRGFEATPYESIDMPRPPRLTSPALGFSHRTADIVDVDSNHYPDLFSVSYDGEPHWQTHLRGVYRQPHDALARVTNPLGGHTRILYRMQNEIELVPYDAEIDDSRPHGGGLSWVVAEVVDHDPVSGGQANVRTRYRYRSAFFDTERREYRGFREVGRSDSYGATVRTLFHQRRATHGKPERISTYAEPFWSETFTLGRLLEETLYFYDCGPNNSCRDAQPDSQGRFFPVLSRQERWRYPSTQDVPWNLIPGANQEIDRVSFDYDACGNMTRQIHQEWDRQTQGYKTLRAQGWSYDRLSGNAGCNETAAVCDGICNRPTREAVLGGLQKNYAYDGRGNLIHEIRVGNDNPTITRMYNGYGNVVVTRDPRGVITLTEYDAQQLYPVKETADVGGLGHVVTASYDPRFGTIASRTDPAGATTRWTYDVLGRLSQIFAPGDAAWVPSIVRSYFPAQRRIDVKTFEPKRGGYLTASTFVDGLGRPLQSQARRMVNGQEKVVVLDAVEYGPDGRVIREFDVREHDDWVIRRRKMTPGDAHTRISYDEFGRVLSRRAQDGATTTTSYKNPRVTEVCDAVRIARPGRGMCIKTTTDALDRTVDVSRYLPGSIFPERRQTSFYDLGGRLTRLRLNYDPKTDVHFFYDTLDRQVAIKTPDQTSIRWTIYDKNDNPHIQASSRGLIQTEYDNLNRPTLRRSTQGGEITQDVVYTYDDANGFGEGRVDSVGTIRYPQSSYSVKIIDEYDVRGNVLKQGDVIYYKDKRAAYYTSYTYDAIGRPLTMTLPHPDSGHEEVRYDYGPTGELRGILSDKENLYANGLQYDLLGRITRIVFGNGLIDEMTYLGPWGEGNPGHGLQLKAMVTKRPNGGGWLRFVRYTDFDENGKLLASEDGRLNAGDDTLEQHAGYDDASRLVNWRRKQASPAIGYGYDRLGNITRSGFKIYGYGSHGPHQPSYVDNTLINERFGMDYDAHGNMTRLPNERTLTFDLDDRLLEVRKDGLADPLAIYAYAAGGRRILSHTAEGTKFFFENFDVLEDEIIRHIRAGDRLIASSTVSRQGAELYD